MTKAECLDRIDELEAGLEGILTECDAEEPDLSEIQRIAEDALGISEEEPGEDVA